MIFFYGVGWVVTGILAAGFMNGYWRGKYPDLIQKDGRRDLIRELVVGLLFGPIGLLSGFLFRAGQLKSYGWSLSGSKEIEKEKGHG